MIKIIFRLALSFLCLVLVALSSTPPVIAQSPPPAKLEGEPVSLEMLVDNQTGYEVDVLYRSGGQYVLHTKIPVGRSMRQAVTSGFTWYFGVNGETVVHSYTNTDSEIQNLTLDDAMIVAAGLPSRANAPSLKGSPEPQDLPPPRFSQGPEITSNVPPPPEVDEAALNAGLDPIFGPLIDWYSFDKDAFSINSQDGRILTAEEDGTVRFKSFERGVIADTKSAWIATPLADRPDRLRLSNVYFYDSYLYIDQTRAFPGSPLLLGVEGQDSDAGVWFFKGTEFQSIINDAQPSLFIGADGTDAILRSPDYSDSTSLSQASGRARMDGNAFFIFSSANYLELSSLIAPFTEMANEIARLDQQVAEAARQKEENRRALEAAAAERRRIAAIPQVYRSQGGISSRLGVGDVFEGENGEKAIKFSFNESKSAEILTIDLGTSTDPMETQYADLLINPEVSAWVQDGELFLAVKTNETTTINMRHGETPSASFPTDGNFFVGHVRANLRLNEGREVMWSPTVQNKQVGFGTSTDTTSGFNVSAEEIVGADFSNSTGSNVNFEAREYEVSGIRGPGPSVIGSMQYEWDSCGLADKPKTDEACTYSSPVDFYDEATSGLRKIPLIAQALTGLETVTIFKNRFPKQGLSSNVQIHLVIDVQFHAVKIVERGPLEAATENTQGFLEGLTFPFQPQLWDFGAPLEDQTVIKNALQTPIGTTLDRSFVITMHLNVDDLKPYMN